MNCQFTQNDYEAIPITSNLPHLEGMGAELLLRDANTWLLLAWAGTADKTAPTPEPACVGTIANLAPTTQEMLVTWAGGVFSCPAGAINGELILWDSQGHRFSSAPFTLQVLPDFTQGG